MEHNSALLSLIVSISPYIELSLIIRLKLRGLEIVREWSRIDVNVA